MPAYLIAEHVVTDATKFEEYRTKVGPMITKYGERYLRGPGTYQNSPGGHYPTHLSPNNLVKRQNEREDESLSAHTPEK